MAVALLIYGGRARWLAAVPLGVLIVFPANPWWSQAMWLLIWWIGAAMHLLHARRALAVALLAASVMALVALAAVNPAAIEITGSRWSQLAQVLVAVILSVAIFVLPWPKVGPIRRAMERAAKFSYSLYIVHFPLLLLFLALSIEFIGHSKARAVMLGIFGLTAAIGCAKLIAMVFERPHTFRDLLRRCFRPRCA